MTNREIAEKWTAAHRQGLLNVKDCIESAIEEAADAWNKRVEVRLEWVQDGHNPYYWLDLRLGKCTVGEVDGFSWCNKIAGVGCGSSGSQAQAKLDCEASVRQSLSELMEG